MIWRGVPCIVKDTTAMTAKSASQSPNRLMTCAYHTRRITSMRSTSRKVMGGAWGAAAAVAINRQVYNALDVGGGQRFGQVPVRQEQESADLIPVWTVRRGVAQRRG